MLLMKSYLEKHFESLNVSRRDNLYDYASAMHQHLEICYVLSGRQKITIGETQYCLEEGDAAFIFSNVPHSYQKASEQESDSTQILLIVFEIHFLRSQIPDIENYIITNPYIPKSLILPDTKMAFERIEGARNFVEEKAWLYLILSNFLPEVGLVRKSSADELAGSLVSYIEDNFYEPLTIEHLAKKFSYHPSYISHLFSDRLDIPFRTYLISVRCSHAVYLLKNTDKSITEIALQCGFNSVNTLGRCFRKVFGVSPSKFRKSPQAYQSRYPLNRRVLGKKIPYAMDQNESSSKN